MLKKVEPQCDGCKALGPDLNLLEKDLFMLGGKGLYCAECRFAVASQSSPEGALIIERDSC